ncbi:hypothetical protein A9F13_05g01815 [Clavispora lusitaniae]|uniref:BTB domain-containing protein n=1 Tax=Clavispora lusitaniae TaxID=36911 RepID=A0AA91T2T3_CLALS|nr:hypothetical protein A9F13_05g01815 [Clavispora lusitaniae]
MGLPKLSKTDLLRRDVFGRTPLHIAVLCDNPGALRTLLAHPDIHHVLLATDYENGWNLLHHIFYHKRIRCWTVLLDYLSHSASQAALLAELLKRKDRSRLPPLALLANDAKDLMWVPAYINEGGDVHLVRRFAKVPRWIPHDWWTPRRGGSDVYMYGANGNHHLGMGDAHDRSVPSRVSPLDLHAAKTGDVQDFDVRDLLRPTRVCAVAIAKYHSVLITRDGRLLTCGLGARGRLGHGNTANLYRFQNVALFGDHRAVAAAVSNSHTLVLTADNQLYAWGINSLNQLGFTSEDTFSFKSGPRDVYENSPKLVGSGDLRRAGGSFRGVAVSKIHSLAYTSHSLYFWGLNVGQMGPMTLVSDKPDEFRLHETTFKGSVVPQPREVGVRDEIKSVATCETCTCVVTVSNDIYVYYGGQRAKLPKVPARGFSDASFDCFKPSRLTKAPEIKKIVACSHTNVHVLLTCGDILAFSIPTGGDLLKSVKNLKYNYLWKAYDSDMRAVDMDGAYDGSLVLSTKNGSVFVRSAQGGTSQRRNSVSTSAAQVSGSKFRKIDNVNRVVRVSCDDSFSSFAFVRDDIDTLPLKLQKNDFFKDMEYLSVLCEADSFRKQDQLLDTDHENNCYVTDYIFPSRDPDLYEDEALSLVNRVEKLTLNDENQSDEAVDDVFLKAHFGKFDHTKHPQTQADDMYQKLDDAPQLMALLKNETALREHLAQEISEAEIKVYDGRIKFMHDPTVVIGFHTNIFEQRSTFCKDLFHPQNDGEYFVHDKIEGHYDAVNKEIIFKSDVDVRALVVLVHFIYTNKVLNFWDEYPGGSKCPEPIRRAKNDFVMLKDLFRMDSIYGKDQDYLLQMAHEMEDSESGDVVIELSDKQESCQGSILVARSAFFETILSGRWDNSTNEDDSDAKIVNFDNTTALQFKVIKNYLHGCNDLHVFDDARVLVEETLDPDDFVNFLLQLIEVADEMLLLKLKHLCELAIQEFLSTDNVLVLLAHSDYLGARYLFMSCCWYIYNNLEIVLFDNILHNLPEDLLARLEKQMRFFQTCKHLDFVIGDHGEINKSMLKSTLPETLIDEFLTNSPVFNEIFMSDKKGFSSFEPLLDIKPENEDHRRKSSSRRMSRKSSVEAVADLRKLSNSTRKVSECAVEDFEVVGRRRKSKQKDAQDKEDLREVQAASVNGVKKEEREKAPLDREGVSMHHNGSSSSIIGNILQGTDNGDSSSSTPWTSRRSSSSSLAPISAPLLGAGDVERKSTKIKFAPSMKLSQKQRRKLAQGQADEKDQPSGEKQNQQSMQLRNPWNVASSSSNESKSAGKDKLKNLPVLGASKQPAPTSLAAVMLHESTRLEEQQYQESQRRTLQEIQQEQEFAKWWEEESRRVQMMESRPPKPRRKRKGGKPSAT